MEILEMFCDLLLARFGLVTQLKELDDGISEAVASIIWVAPRLQADVAELKVISDMLTAKYGKPYADACRAGVPPANVSDKLQHKMSIQAPPKLLVEKYLIEIAKIFNIDYEPDQSIMKDDSRPDGFLIDFAGDKNNLDGNIPAPPGPGFAQFPQPPPIPILPHPPQNIPFNYPPGPSYPNQGPYPNQGGGSYPNQGGGSYPNVPSAPYNYNIPPNPSNNTVMPPSLPQQPPYPSGHPEKKDLNVNFLNVSEIIFISQRICTKIIS
jgi:vacuolar protein sorting-associated protein IST1